MVSSEAAPFAKTGGLGEVLEALPKALAQAGEEIAVVLPLYRTAVLSNPRLIYERLQFDAGPHRYWANILEQLAGGVRYLFVQLPELYDRDQLYAEQDLDYPDNHLRFGALCGAALAIARHVFMPQVVHCHDWQAALFPVLLREASPLDPAHLGIKTVLTIHNLGYQGIFDRSVLADLGLPESSFPADAFDNGKVNLFKAGLLSSDVLTTVSPCYAQEIQTPQFGCGLDPVLRARNNALFGILNGTDYTAWDPATDALIAQRFHSGDLSGKQACKRDLLAEAGLSPERFDKPLIAVVSRLAEQKGFDLLMQISDELLSEDVSLVVLGSGEQRFEEFFRWLQSAYPAQVSVTIGYEEAAAHRMYAGADMVLMPSHYEPCGLIQMYGMRYGALPLVHATGGLDDTVDEETGFKFRNDSGADLLESIRRALEVYGTPRWQQMIRFAMQRQFSWEAAAASYIRIYKQLSS